MHIAEVVTIAKSLPLLRLNTYKSLILSYSADYRRIFTKNPLRKDEFYNPILQGCYPDPSICRRGDDYYLVCSSFAMFPGVPVFHSTDLVNWRQVGHALDRPSQLKVHDAGTSNGVYAPTIRYNPHNEMFYMITTQVSGGFGNMMVKTKNPEEGWSDPIKLHFNGIDPSIFFDDDGKAYIVHNDGPKKSLWKGHRVIKLWEYDVETDFSFGATVDYRPRSESDLAGIACMQNRNAQIVLGLTKKDGRTMITLVRRLKDKTEILGESEIVGKRPVRLQVEAQGEDFRFSYSTDGHVYHNVGGKVDGAFLSTTVAGGFVGNVVGLYATSGNNR